MYRLSMKPQYENWCNCCAVSLFSPWVTPGLSLCFFCRVTLFSFLPLSTLPRSLALCQFTYCLFPPLHCAISPSLPLRSPMLYSLYPPQPQRPDLLPLLGEQRSFCLPPAAVTWRHAGGDSESDEPAVSATPPHKHGCVCLELTACGWEGQILFVSDSEKVPPSTFVPKSVFTCIKL